MVRSWRWLVVASGALALAVTPALVAAVPTSTNHLTAAALLQQVKSSSGHAYSGYAESTGGLGLPVTRQFSSVADLFGGTTQMRVWWRSTRDWRLDTITLAGETDLHTSRLGSWTWDYESNAASYLPPVVDPEVRLPIAADLVPANLGRRLLSRATDNEVTRLATRRIAGHSVPGIELRPTDRTSTIDRVDVWAEPNTGLALRVDVFGKGDLNSTLSTSFLDFSLITPKPAETAFLLPTGASIRTDTRPDFAAAIDRLGRGIPPPTLAGMPRTPLEQGGSVGVYGRGVATFAAVPLPERTLSSLRTQLLATPGVVIAEDGTSVNVGPVTLFLSQRGTDGISWLLTGTVTLDALRAAARELRQ
jgi:hypothetical protein